MVVEYQRDGLLAGLHVLRSCFFEFLEECGEQFVEHETAHILCEQDLTIRRTVIVRERHGRGTKSRYDSHYCDGEKRKILFGHGRVSLMVAAQISAAKMFFNL